MGPVGSKLAVASRTNELTIYNAYSFGVIHSMECESNVCSPAWSPDGTLLAVGYHNKVALMNTSTYSKLCTHYRGFWVHAISFHPNGCSLAIGGNNMKFGLVDISMFVNGGKCDNDSMEG